MESMSYPRADILSRPQVVINEERAGRNQDTQRAAIGTTIVSLVVILGMYIYFYSQEHFGLSPSHLTVEFALSLVAPTFIGFALYSGLEQMRLRKVAITVSIAVIMALLGLQVYASLSTRDLKKQFGRTVNDMSTAERAGTMVSSKVEIRDILAQRDDRLKKLGVVSIHGWSYGQYEGEYRSNMFSVYAPAPWLWFQK